ncbi:unnamed protein product [Closterium sp. NIES-53]
MVQYRPPSARAGRFSQRAQWGLHLGIERNYNAWKIFDIHSKETVAARDVIFCERLTLPTYLANLEEERDPKGGFRGDRAFASAVDEADWDEQNVDNASEEAGPLPYCSVPIPMDDENPRESVNAETYFDFADTGYVTPAEVNTNEAERIGPNFIPDPETGEHREKWREAMDKELKALEERNTWKFVPIGVSRNKTVLTGKWVFHVKTKADDTIDKFKARWVVRGFDQEHGRHFTETFAPVSRHTSLRILLAVAAMKKKKLRQIDVANAFLYAPVEAEIYVELPHGELLKDLTLTVSSTVTQYLGLNIQEGESAIYLNAAKYADTITKRFALTPTTISTPYRYMAGNNKAGSASLKPAGIRDYQRKLGCLLFAAVTCRPDLSYSASQLATYLKRPEAEHMMELDHALHYLVSTPTIDLIYYKNKTNAQVNQLPQALYDAVVARYSSPATAALGRLLLPYLFPELSAFATVEDLVTHLRTSDGRYRAAVPAKDHFLALDPTVLTVDLLEQHHLVAETSVFAIGAARGTPRTLFFEGCSPSPLAPSYVSAAAVDVLGAQDVGAASASGKSRCSKGKGGRGGGGGSGGGFLRVGRLGVMVAARMSFARVTVLVRHAGSLTLLHYCFSRLDDAWRADFGDEAERPRLAELLRSGVAIFDQDYDATISVMYALSVSAEGDCYMCVPPDPGKEAASLGASEFALLGTASAKALHTFIFDSCASRYFFRDSTTLTPLSAPVLVRLADPSGGPILARSSTVLPCPAVPSGSLSGLHLLSFSTNLVSTAALHDAMVTTTTPGGQHVTICTCTRTGRQLATFFRRPGSSLYTLATEPLQVAASAQVSASGPVAPPCSCRLLSHETLLWNHRLGHPSLPRLRGMHSDLLVSGLPRSLPPLLPDVLIPWIRAVHLQLRERFRQDLPIMRLHPDRGGEFSSDLLWDFCRGEGILQSFTLPDSPQQNGIIERRIGLVMEVARTSMIHAAAPHFLWPFAVRYAMHQL